jgi:hypothetical protein
MSSPQRRLTSAFDLDKSRWGSWLQFEVSEYMLSLLPLKQLAPRMSRVVDHKTLLAVTNAAVEPSPIVANRTRATRV